MMASEEAETCRFINTIKTSCVLTYFTFYFIVTNTTLMPQLKVMCAYSLVFTLWQCAEQSLKMAQCQTQSPPVDSEEFIVYSSIFQQQ